MKKLLEKLFLIREIRSKSGELHFKRWRLLSTPWFSIFLHQIFKSDTDHPHDHPWDFWAFILKGGYLEYCNGESKLRIKKLGSWFYKSATEFHSFSLIKPTTTLVIAKPRKREWGYHIYDGWIHNEDYRFLKKWKHLFNMYDTVRFKDNAPNGFARLSGVIEDIYIDIYADVKRNWPFAMVKWKNGSREAFPVNCLILNRCTNCDKTEAKYTHPDFWCEKCYNDWCFDPGYALKGLLGKDKEDGLLTLYVVRAFTELGNSSSNRDIWQRVEGLLGSIKIDRDKILEKISKYRQEQIEYQIAQAKYEEAINMAVS